MTDNNTDYSIDLYTGYCHMPALWLNSFYGLTQFKHTQISNLPLPNDINRSNKRLGKLAEDLFSFWAKNQPDLTIICENLQIID